MPRSSSDKTNPGGSKPYVKNISITKAQADDMARAVATAILSAFNIEAEADDLHQTTHSEDEEEMEEDTTDESTPVTMSSSSSYDALQATLAPLREKIANSEAMLVKLSPFMRTFVETKNQHGIAETAALMVEHEAIVSDTRSEVTAITLEWEEGERAKKEEEKAAKRTAAASKLKGKDKVPRDKEDEQLARLAELIKVPEGDLFPFRSASRSNQDPTLAALYAIRDGPQPTTPTKPSLPSIASRFSNSRVLPSGFHLSQGPSLVKTSPNLPSTSANPFEATPLVAPEDFSPSKILGTKVSAPKAITAPKKQRGGKAGGGGTRASTRTKKDVTYEEPAEVGSDDLED